VTPLWLRMPSAAWTAFALCTIVAAGCGDGRDARPPTSSVDSTGVDGLCASVAARDAVVLGGARAPDGTPVALIACDGSCLILRGLPGGERGCGVAPSRRDPPLRDPLGGGAFVQRSPRGRIELHGNTSHAVRRVLVRYRDHRRLRQRSATLIEARQTAALRAAGINGPFGYFVAFVPAGARDVVVEAHGNARRSGSLRFGPILRSLHPRVFILRPVRPDP
jgi:hypothetical protein